MPEAETQPIILLVDDNPTNLGVLFESLNDSGFQLLVAEDGESALEQVNYAKPDIVLLDVMMPGIDGFETCRRLKAEPLTQGIPVIFMTALADTVDKVKGLSIGAVDYITKPIQPDEVLARVRTHLTLKSLQEQLQQQNQQLQREIQERQQAEERLRVFLHAVSHDLRNPVMGLLMVLRNLLDQAESPQVPRSLLERMAQSCDRQLVLINSLVETQSGEIWGISLQCQPISLLTLAQELAATWQPLLAEAGATLKCQIPADLPQVEADPYQLWRVYENLLGNALKYNGTGLTLTLRAALIPAAEQDGGSEIRCTVEDDGVGMPAEQAEELFRLYSRGRNSRQTLGLGLGLYLCQQIVQAHGGQIGVTSQPAQGATFWFTLPLASPSEVIDRVLEVSRPDASWHP